MDRSESVPTVIVPPLGRTQAVRTSTTGNDDDASDDSSLVNPIELAASATITALDLEKFLKDNEETIMLEEGLRKEEDASTSTIRKAMNEILHQDPDKVKETAKVMGERFFEYFLGGSAGVIYSSFLGLINTNCIRYGESSY